MTKIINFCGGPCCGKSSISAGLFSLMKLDQESGLSIELVTEVVKGHVYDENKQVLDDQLLITAQQNHELKRLVGKVDYVISDASLINGIVYNEFYGTKDPVLDELALNLFKKYNNVVYLLPRKKIYNEYGRTQSEDEAKIIDMIFIKVLEKNNIEYYDMRGVEHKLIPALIYKDIQNGII